MPTTRDRGPRHKHRRQQRSVSPVKTVGLARARAGFLRPMAPGWCRWYPTSPAHLLAVAIQERIDTEARLQGCGPSQSPRFAQPFLSQERENRLMGLPLHARREKSKIPNAVPVAVRDVIGQRG